MVLEEAFVPRIFIGSEMITGPFGADKASWNARLIMRGISAAVFN
jgi:hypothetical protein